MTDYSTITLRLTAKTAYGLELLARKRHSTKSAVIRDAIARALGDDATNAQSNCERVRNAMRVVFSHKVGDVECMASEVWDLLAETAVKTMYLIDLVNEEKNR